MTTPGNINFSWDALAQTALINGRLLMGGIVGPFVAPASMGIIYFDSATNLFKASENGHPPVNLLTGGGGGSAYTTIQNNGTMLAQEDTLNLVAGTGLQQTVVDTPGVKTTYTPSIANTGVTASTYNYPTIAVNAQGQITSASSNTAASSVSNVDGTLTISPTTGAVIASINEAHANTWTGKQSFTTSASLAGLELIPVAADPSTPTNGDMWYNSSTGHFRAYENGVAKNVIVSAGPGSTAYTTVQNNGVSVAQEQTINFIPGTNVTLGIMDNPGTATNVTINATGGGTASSNALAENNAGLSLTANVDNPIALNTTIFDSGSFHNNITHNSRLTVPATGQYLVTVQAYGNNGTATQWTVNVPINASYGATLFGRMQVIDQTSGALSASLCGMDTLNAGDYIEVDIVPNGTVTDVNVAFGITRIS